MVFNDRGDTKEILKVKREKIKFHFSVIPFIGFLLLIFVLFQPPFGFDVSEFVSEGGGPSQLGLMKMMIENPSQITEIEEESKELGMEVHISYFMIMCSSLALAILLFLISSLGLNRIGRSGNQVIGIIAAILSLIYAGMNYLIVSQFTARLSIFASSGGLSFGVAGWVALFVGGVYLICSV